jgi:micrococcal nuclease
MPKELSRNLCLAELLACLFSLYLPAACVAGESRISGLVIKVSDGDTLTILAEGNRQVRVRLDGIDCPELHQAYGTKARQFTSAMTYRKTVSVFSNARDKYGRTLGTVFVNGINLNEELVKLGLAWAYIHFSTRFLPLEREARAKRIGLWADKNPIPPWEFRNKRKQRG